MQRRIFIFIMFTAAFFLSHFFQLANAVIAPDLSTELNLTAAQLGLMSSVFFATFAAAQIPLGIGLDRWGPRWVTPGLMLIGVLGCLIFATATSLPMLTIGRGLMGIGMASVLMGSLKAFSQWYPPERFATMAGLLVGIGSTGAFFAATPLAWLNGLFGWRAVFGALGMVTLIVVGVIFVFGRNTPPGVDWPKPEQGQGGIGQVLRDARFWRIAPLALFLVGTGLGFQGLWVGPYLFDVYGLSQINAGNLLLLLAAGATIGAVCSGWLADRFALSHVVLLATSAFVLSQLMLAVRPPLFVVGIALFLFGFTKASNIVVLTQIRHLFPDEITGQALTAVNLCMFVGIFLVQWLLGVIISLFTLNAEGLYPPNAYTTVLLVTAACNIVAIIIYYPLAKQSKT